MVACRYGVCHCALFLYIPQSNKAIYRAYRNLAGQMLFASNISFEGMGINTIYDRVGPRPEIHPKYSHPIYRLVLLGPWADVDTLVHVVYCSNGTPLTELLAGYGSFQA